MTGRKANHLSQSSWGLMGPGKIKVLGSKRESPTFSKVTRGNNLSLSNQKQMIYGRSVRQAPPRVLQTKVLRQVQQNMAAAGLPRREAGQRGDEAGKEGDLDLGRP